MKRFLLVRLFLNDKVNIVDLLAFTAEETLDTMLKVKAFGLSALYYRIAKLICIYNAVHTTHNSICTTVSSVSTNIRVPQRMIKFVLKFTNFHKDIHCPQHLAQNTTCIFVKEIFQFCFLK